jgi:pyruvate, water dikinase
LSDARYVLPLEELGLGDVGLVGGKSAHLGDLLAAGFPVPSGFAVATHALDVSSPRAVEGGLPEGAAAAIRAAYAALGDDVPVAVRSSAVAEDGADASFAGVQDTYLWIRGVDEVVRAVERCWASYFNSEAVAYREHHAGATPGMSVAVQRMVDARVSGVMFTLNPVSGDPSCIAIDASYGLGVTVVGGEVTPDTFVVSKVTREILRSEVGAKAVEVRADGRHDVAPERRARLSLEPAEVQQLAELGRMVERHYGRAQDIEWSFDDERLWLLQSRDETVWAARRQPREVAAGPLAAIAATYLGKRR